jgi:transposase
MRKMPSGLRICCSTGGSRGSYIPETVQRELTRYRASLIQDRVRMVNRLQKTLEDTNSKLGDVVSAIMGQSARDMLEALQASQTDPTRLAKLARGRMKAKHAQLEEALVGTLKPHHPFLLSEQLAQIDSLEEAITRVSLEITRRMHAQEPAQERRSGRESLRVFWPRSGLLCHAFRSREAPGLLGRDVPRQP